MWFKPVTQRLHQKHNRYIVSIPPRAFVAHARRNWEVHCKTKRWKKKVNVTVWLAQEGEGAGGRGRTAQKGNPPYFFLPSDPPQLSTLATQARRKLNVKTKFFPRLISKLLTLMSVAFERRLKVNIAFTSVPLFWFVREHRVCSRFCFRLLDPTSIP